MNDLLIGLKSVGAVAAAYLCFMVLRGLSRASGHLLASRLLPAERRLLEWLQDRATARTMGIDVDVIRARRKIDFPDYRP